MFVENIIPKEHIPKEMLYQNLAGHEHLMSPIESDCEDEIAETEEPKGSKFGMYDAESPERRKVEENIAEEMNGLKLEPIEHSIADPE